MEDAVGVQDYNIILIERLHINVSQEQNTVRALAYFVGPTGSSY